MTVSCSSVVIIVEECSSMQMVCTCLLLRVGRLHISVSRHRCPRQTRSGQVTHKLDICNTRYPCSQGPVNRQCALLQ